MKLRLIGVPIHDLHRGYGTLDRPPNLPFHGERLDESPAVLRAEARAQAEIETLKTWRE